jgi:glycosyltransferase involved in cell wall biosynthesis
VEISDMQRDISIIAEIKSSWKMLQIIWKEKPDVLHLNSPKASGFGSVAGRLSGTKKIIQTIHGWSFNEKRGFISGMLIYFFSWLTTMLCHTTIVIAEKEGLQAQGMPLVSKNKLVLIKNGISPIEFKDKETARKEILTRIGKQELTNTTWIGSVSELTANKGLNYAIIAMAKITTPFIFCIIGEGENRANLEKLIEAYNLKDKVFLLGFMDNANQYLKAFDIFTFPSIKEGLPYAILEAGLASLPVVASSVGGIPEIIENNVSGVLVSKERPPEITIALQYLITNPNKAVEFGQNLKSKVETEFSLPQMLQKTFALYQ